MSVWAILVAAGRGERLGLDQPKAFAKLGEDPLLAEPLRRLDECEWVDAIVLVAPPGWEEPAILLAEELGCGKVAACVPGGETRTDSVRAGLAEVAGDALVILVHDAARPLLDDGVVRRVLAPLSEGWDGAIPGLAVADTLKRAGGDGAVLAPGERAGATAGRQFVLLAAPEHGCASVTQFVGFIPPGRAPDHFHGYDEVVYVLDGEGALHIAGESAPLHAGVCVHLPARLVHCLENTGDGEMRVLGVFRPAGSPAEAYYPDGTVAVVPEGD